MSGPSSFEFRGPGRILFGRGVFAQAAACALPLGKRALVVTGASALVSGWPSASNPKAGERNPGAIPGRTLRREHRRRDTEGPRTIPPSPGMDPFEPGTGMGSCERDPADQRITEPRSETYNGSSVFGSLTEGLEAAGMGIVHYVVRGEPTTRVADEGARLAIASGCDFVVGLGGGSVLDAAKTISGLMTNGGEALDYLEIVGRGREIESPAAPFLAIPTTAGTGSEATKNAVLTESRARVKVSLRSPHLLPSVALVDPDLTLTLPPMLTASTGLDALTQLIEAYLTPRANPMTDLIVLEGLERSARSLLAAVNQGSNAAAREDLALASLFGGLALSNAGLGAVHGIAAPLGGRFPVPHGIACAVLLPHVLQTNLGALRRLDPAGPGLRRMARLGEALAGSYRAADGSLAEDRNDEHAADTTTRLVRRLVSQCGLPGLAVHGITSADLPAIAEAASRASSMRGNPVPLSHEEIVAAIAAAL